MSVAVSRFVVLCAVFSACGSGGAPLDVKGDTSSDLPLPGVDEPWRARFDEGDALFDVAFREADGLGPLYIRQSCGACHRGAGRGPGFVERLVQVEADGLTPVPGQPALPRGSVVRPFSTSGATPVLAPERADVKVTTRTGIPVMGRGWLEAVDDAEIERVEREQAQRTDGVSGRINRVVWHSAQSADTRFHRHRPGDVLIGRFGLKARQATLDDFAADALQGDMGLTSPLRPNEVANAEGVTDDAKPGLDVDAEHLAVMADYVRLIAIPRRATPNARGRELFGSSGCAVCHVPSLRTRADYPIAPMAGADAAVFTDLLLHDMGPALADGLPDESAHPSEWRTAPLIGLRFLASFLHDGRTTSLEQAVLLHGAEGSEAKPSVDAFRALPASDQAALLDFVSSL